jgi:hypothetical protein
MMCLVGKRIVGSVTALLRKIIVWKYKTFGNNPVLFMRIWWISQVHLTFK